MNGGKTAAGLLCGLAAAGIWGGWLAVTRAGVTTTLSAMDIAALRFAVAGLILLPVVVRRGLAVGPWGIRGGLVLAAGAGVPYVLLMASGLSLAPTAHGALTPTTMPICTTVLAWLLLGNRPSWSRVVGLLVAVSGMLLLAAPGLASDLEALAVGGYWRGDLLFMAAGLSWAIYTVASMAWKVDPRHGTAIVSVLSMAGLLPVYLASGGLASLATAPLADILVQAVVQGVLTSIVALLAYNKAVALLGAPRAALFPILMPAIATLSAIPLLGEWPSGLETAGLVVIGVGLGTAMDLPFFRLAARVPTTAQE